MDGLTIGKVARGAGLAFDAVRYYEREGLLALRVTPGKSCADVRERIAAAIERMGYKIVAAGH